MVIAREGKVIEDSEVRKIMEKSGSHVRFTVLANENISTIVKHSPTVIEKLFTEQAFNARSTELLVVK